MVKLQIAMLSLITLLGSVLIYRKISTQFEIPETPTILLQVNTPAQELSLHAIMRKNLPQYVTVKR